MSFFKWAISGLFFICFCLFKQTYQVLLQINVKKCPSRIQCWDLNPQPSEHKSPLITTRPALQEYRLYVSEECLIPFVLGNGID